MNNITPAFTQALKHALNGQLLLFQHANPTIPVASMPPHEALNRALGLKPHVSRLHCFQGAVRFLGEATGDLPTEDIPLIITQAITGPSLDYPPEEAMFDGVLNVFERPLKEVLEQFRMAEPVRLDPTSKAAWLVYADWLMEQGDPRGELIQIDHERKNVTDVEVKNTLKRRKEELERILEREWRLAFGGYLKFSDASIGGQILSVRNGYVDTVGTAREDLEQGRLDSLFKFEGLRFLRRWLANVDGSGRRDQEILNTTLNLPYLRSLRTLNLYHRLDSEGVRLLANCPRLQCLQGLELVDSGIDDTGVHALTDSPYLKSLQILEITGNHRIGNDGARAFMNRGNFPKLTHLNLDHINTRRMGREVLDALIVWTKEQGITFSWQYR